MDNDFDPKRAGRDAWAKKKGGKHSEKPKYSTKLKAREYNEHITHLQNHLERKRAL